MTGTLQGWHADPFGRFEQRYFSNGTPTALVRVGRAEAHDNPSATVAESTHASVASEQSVSAPAEVLTYRVYERRRHRVLAPLALATAWLTPIVGWELLVANRDRVFGAVAFVVVAVTLTIIVRMFASPKQRRDNRACTHIAESENGSPASA